jgi:hypothetical protein
MRYPRTQTPGQRASTISSEDNTELSADQIRSKHVFLIEGMNELYETLVRMQYVPPNSLPKPPHTPLQVSPDIPKLQAEGFSAEAIALLHELPFLSNEVQDRYAMPDEGVPLAA